MANELIHGTQGTVLTQAEFEAVGLHVCNSQATGDLIYASSATQLTRLGIGTAGQFLITSGGVPAWSKTLPDATIVPNLGTIGQAAGPLLTFDDTDDFLKITGCHVNIGPTSEARTLFYLDKTWAAINASNAGIRVRVTQNGANTSSLLGLDIALTKGTAATTLGGMRAINIGTPTITGTVDEVYGIVISNQGNANATTAYGLYINAPTGSATNRMLFLDGGGNIDFAGSTSGIVRLAVAAVAGTWTLTLPATAGSAGQRLTTDGAGVCSWAA